MQLALTALSAAVGAWWLGAWVREPDLLLALCSVAVGSGVAWALRRRLATPQRQLAWDGSTWLVGDPDSGLHPGQIALMLDLGDWMLVCFSVDGAPRSAAWRSLWLPLRRRDAAESWPALRVALYAAQPAARAA